MSAPLDDCASQSLSPLRMVSDMLVCLLVAGSFVPQVVRIIDRNSNEGISEWHMVLMMISVNAHLAARIGGTFTKATSDCIRSGQLQGWKAFSGVIMVLQILVHWVAAITLLAVYLSSPHRQNNQNENAGYFSVPISDPGIDERSISESLDIRRQDQTLLTLENGHPSLSNVDSASNTPPSNATILAVVITHGFVFLPPALYILFNKLSLQETYGFGFFQQGLYLILSVAGLATSLASMIPQVYTMATRYHIGLGLGSLSVLSIGLQALAFGALCISQSARLWFWDADVGGWLWPFFIWFVDTSGPAVSYGVLMFGQLVVFFFALWIDGKRGADLLLM